jgi:hypothetical protein
LLVFRTEQLDPPDPQLGIPTGQGEFVFGHQFTWQQANESDTKYPVMEL